MTDVPTTETRRETRREARERITAELMAAARRQLAEVGAAGLSVREVAREIGMVSSAVYRYVESRDDLLTRLITEAYDSIGEATEAASLAAVTAEPRDDLGRWSATADAIRDWALANVHEYLLLYGTPVPGYAAPEGTVEPGTRPVFALVAIITDAHAGGRLVAPTEPTLDPCSPLAGELIELAGAGVGELDATTILAFFAAWTQLFGLVSFEITNQTRNSVTDADALFRATVHRLGHQIGLRDDGGTSR